jgi:hypothetical protein
MFADSALYEQVYDHNGVTIFAVQQQSAAPATNPPLCNFGRLEGSP